MITLKDLKYDAKWMQLDFTDKQLSDIYSTIDSESFSTMEEMDELRGDSLDVIFFYDRSIVALLDNLSDMKGSEQDIVEMTAAQYGRVIDLYYLNENQMYAMAVGNR